MAESPGESQGTEEKEEGNWQISADAKYPLALFKRQSIGKDLLLISEKQIHVRSPESTLQCQAAS